MVGPQGGDLGEDGGEDAPSVGAFLFALISLASELHIPSNEAP